MLAQKDRPYKTAEDYSGHGLHSWEMKAQAMEELPKLKY